MLKWLVGLLVILLSTYMLVFYVGKPSLSYFSKDSFYDSDREYYKEEFLRAYNHTPISSGIVEVNFSAYPSRVEIAPGYVFDNLWAYNGTIPGPVIRIKLGQTLKLNFVNNLPQETTIHFHGVRVPNAMDGVPGVTQPPIKPGDNFTYVFTPKDPGTYWFHPHVRGHEQLERGLYGALIVEDQASQYFDKDEVIFLDDWLVLDNRLIENFDNRHFVMMNGRIGNLITVNGKFREIIYAKEGERVRLRFINAANARIFRLSVRGEQPYIIAVDGFYVREPFPLTSFDIAPGNRVDLDVLVEGNVEIYDAFTNKTLVVVNVQGESKKKRGRDYSFINTYIPALEGIDKLGFDRQYVYDIKMKMGVGPVWTINGESWPKVTPYVFERNKLNIVRLKDNSGRIHPIHLHGMFFKVISRNGRFVDEGFYRDTVILYPYDDVLIATVPTEEGSWLNHCHIQEHAEFGFMTYVKVV